MRHIIRFCRGALFASALVGATVSKASTATPPRFSASPEADSLAATEEIPDDEEDLLDEPSPADVEVPQETPVEVPEASRETIEAIDREILEADAELALGGKSGVASIPVEINQNVRKWLHYFSKKDHERFQRFLDRGEVYRNLVKRTLAENGVPTELYYLAMIESGYVIHARSHAAAVGPWQFIRGTGQRYGLMQGFDVDERRDIVRATQSAARYLRGLHLVFQDWYLAMASYNAGEGRILGAMMRGESRDFWKLVELKVLPEETRDYVPKFLAAAIIGRHPERWGFTQSRVEPFPALEGAQVPGGVTFRSIAEKAGIPAERLAELNPHLLRGRTPSGAREYTMWVPAGTASRISEIAGSLEPVREAPPIALKRDARFHKVRAGESLASIAKKYGTTVSKLKKMNGLRNAKVAPGKRIVISPRRNTVSMR